MSYEVKANGDGKWIVEQSGVPIPEAHVKQIECDEGYTDGPNGRTYYPIPGSWKATIRLPNGNLIPGVPLTK